MKEHRKKVASIYAGIRQRCGNANHASYKRYGGRGIKCRITFRELMEIFVRDEAWKMKRPSVDRIDNDGDYVFYNVRWIELQENISRAHLKKPRDVVATEKGFIALTQSQRDSRRETTHIRLGRDIIDLMKKDAKKEKKTIQQVMEAILRTAFKAPK